MKFTELNAKFTELVAKYLSEGYTVCTNTMSGSQGEMAKIDLTKGKELIRIWMDRESSASFFKDEGWHGISLFIRVGKWKYDMDHYSYEPTVWMKDLDTIEEYTYYEVSRLKWYLEDLQEAMEYQKKHYSRYHICKSDVKYYCDERAKQIARKYMINRRGYTRISKDKLSIKRTGRVYYVIYADQLYRVN